MSAFRGRPVVTLAQLDNYASALSQKDCVYWPLYDYQTYPLAGQTLFTFFSLPQGQGTTSAFGGAGPKTPQDTNLTTGGQLPQGNTFVAKGIEMEFFPGVMPAANAAAAIAANASAQFVRDMYTVMRNGVVTLRVQDRNFVQDGPLMKFPTQTRLAGFAAVNETTATTASQVQVNYASACGAAYEIAPLRIFSNQAFQLTVAFPALIPLPSGVDGRFGARIVGDLVRNAQ